MKKLFTFFAVILSLLGASLPANAAWYILGDGLTGTSINSAKTFTDKGDGTFEFIGTFKANTWFKISNAWKSGDWDTFNGGAIGNCNENNVWSNAFNDGDEKWFSHPYASDLTVTSDGDWKITLNPDGWRVKMEKVTIAVTKTISNIQVINGSGTVQGTASSASSGTTWDVTVNSTNVAGDNSAGTKYAFKINYTDGSAVYASVGTNSNYWIELNKEYTSPVTTSSTGNYMCVQGISSGDKCIFSITMNSDGTAATSIKVTKGVTEPLKITSITLHESAGRDSKVLATLTSSGNVWSATVDNVKSANDNDWDCRYYFKLNYSDGSVKYVLVGNEAHFYVTIGTTYTSDVKTLTSRTDGNGFCVKDANGGTFDFILTMSDDGQTAQSVLVQQGVKEPKKISSVQVFNASSQTALGTANSASGTTWVVTVTGTVGASDSNPATSKYVFKVNYSDGTSKWVSVGKNANYWINLATDYPDSDDSALSMSDSKSYYFCVREASGECKFGLTMSADGWTATNIRVIKSGSSADQNYPDFPTTTWDLNKAFQLQAEATGDSSYPQKLYFYLSQYQNDNRVSPEWQLVKQDGSYVLDDFMVIPNGGFRIREFTKASANAAITYTDYGSSYSGVKDLTATTFNLPTSGVAANTKPTYNENLVALNTSGRGFRWQLGYTVAKVEVTPVSGSLQMSLTLNLADYPSTLKQAPKPGMPFILMMGSKLTAPTGSWQTLEYPAKLDDGLTGEENRAFTNGYIQYDADGKLLVYGSDLQTNRNMYSVSGMTDHSDGSNLNTSHRPMAGQVMSSTILPPRNPIQFRIFDDTNKKDYYLTSLNTMLEYDGVVTDASGLTTAKNKNTALDVTVDANLQPSFTSKTATSGTRYARYKLTNFNLVGLYKIFSGYGAHNYNTVVNGLSQFNNWGIRLQQGTYDSEKISSGDVRPLSGGGPILKNDGESQRDATKPGFNDDFEDNKAGAYIDFNERAYVSTAYFYFALDKDGITDADAVHYLQDKNDYTSNGRANDESNYSNNGRNYSWMVFTFNDGAPEINLRKEGANTGLIDWAIAEESKPTDKSITYWKVRLVRTDAKGNPIIGTGAWSIDVDSQDNCDLHWLSSDASEPGLEIGYYRAYLDYAFDGGETQTVPSNVIQVFTVTKAPVLIANQIINRVDNVDEYTFDVLVETNIKDYAEEVENVSGTPLDPTSVKVVFTLPFKNGSQSLTMSTKGDRNTFAAPDMSGYNVTWSAPTGTLTLNSNIWAAGEVSFKLPDIRITDFVPDNDYTFSVKIDAAEVSGLSPEDSDDENVVAPEGWIAGKPMLKKYDETYNAVTLVDDTDPVAVRLVKNAKLAAATANNFDVKYDVSLMTPEGVADKVLASNLAAASGTSNVTKSVAVNVDNLPYTPATAADGTMTTDEQEYSFTIKTTYTRKSDNASATIESEIDKYMPESPLATPRDGIVDRTEAGGNAQDWIRLTYEYGEKYAGAAFVYEDAYVAAEIADPTEELAFKFNATKQEIRHHDDSSYSVKNHDTTSPSQMQGNTNNQWWNTGVQDIPAGFEERVRIYPDETYANIRANGEHSSFWAGDAEGKLDPMESYYDSRNHHTRAGWKGGELMNGTHFSRLVAATASVGTGGNSGSINSLVSGTTVDNPMNSVTDANTVHNAIVSLVDTNKDKNGDVQLKSGVTGDQYGKQIFLGQGTSGVAVNRVMLVVPHVNAESWWQPNTNGMAYDMFARWRSSSKTELSLAKDQTGDQIVENFIQIAPKDYKPLQYSFVYEYPVLTAASYATMTAPATMTIAKAAVMPLASVDASDVKDITAASTGYIPFDAAVSTSSGGTATGVDDLGADADGLVISYDRATAMLSVRTGGELGTVTVTAVSGAVVKNVPAAKGCNALDLDLSGLANGAYIVTVDGAHGTKILR